MTWGSSSTSGLKLGPTQNTFSEADLATAESARDTYFAANPSNFAAYQSNPNNLIRLVYDGNTVYEAYVNGAWTDYTAVLQGLPGEVASLDGVPVMEVPYKLPDGTFGGSKMRMLNDGSLLAPIGFGVESGSVDFGDVITLSESAGFLAIQNNLKGLRYNLLDYETPRDGPSLAPYVFHLNEAETIFIAQPDFSTEITTDPLVYNYTVQNTARVNGLTFKAAAPMSNVRIRMTQISNGIVAKYIPSKSSWEAETDGLEWIAGDNYWDFEDTPLILEAGTVLKFEFDATEMHILGDANGRAYIQALIQTGTFIRTILSSEYTAADVKNKLSTLTGTDRLPMSAIQGGVTSVAERTGDVVLTVSDVAGLAPVASSGAYNDLTGKPTIPTSTSQLTNDSVYITAADIPVTSVAGRTGAVVLTKTDVGLANVDNTSDVNKPVSTAQQTAIDLSMSQHLAAVDPHPQYTTVAEATAAAPVQSVNGNTGAVVLTTGNVAESGNLYYTDARVQAYVSGAGGFNVKSASSLGTGVPVYAGSVAGDIRFRSIIGTGAISITQNANDITISAPVNAITSVNGYTGIVSLTTSDIAEGTNLYYTAARVSTYLSSTGYNVKSVASSGTGSSLYVGNTAGAVTLRSLIVTGNATATQNSNDITINVPAAPVSSVNGQTGAIVLSTTNITEGTNLYYTDARVGSYIGTQGYAVKLVNSVGTGAAVYQGNVSGGVSLRSIIGTGVASVTQNTNDITINVPAPVYPVTSVNSQTGAVVLTTSTVAESGNLYYTDGRVQTYLTAQGYNVKSVSSVGTGSSIYQGVLSGAVTLRSVIGTGSLTVTQNTNDITLNVPALNTTNVTEATNLYYTDARVQAYLTAQGFITKAVASVGTGAAVYSGSVSGTANIRSITAGRGMTVTQNTSDVNVGSTAFPLVYNSSGAAASPKIWYGQVTSDANGDFTINYASAGFTAPPIIHVTALATTTATISDRAWATLQGTPTATTASGYTMRGITLLVLGTAVRTAPTTTVMCMAVGI